MVLSWAFEMTPEGIKREAEVDRAKSIPRKAGRKLTALVVLLAALAAGLMVFRFLRSQPAHRKRETHFACSRNRQQIDRRAAL